MNLHLLLVSAKFVLYFHIYWQSDFERDLSECSMSHTVKPVEEEFVPSVPCVLILGTSCAGPGSITKAHIRVCKPTSNRAGSQSQSLLPGKQSRMAEKGQPCWMKHFSVLGDLASKQLSSPQLLGLVQGWPSLGPEEVLTVQVLQRQPDLIQA